MLAQRVTFSWRVYIGAGEKTIYLYKVDAETHWDPLQLAAVSRQTKKRIAHSHPVPARHESLCAAVQHRGCFKKTLRATPENGAGERRASHLRTQCEHL